MSESMFRIETAVRGVVKPLIGTYGPSGGGKTRSSLILARGIVGPKGRITLICTENKRGAIFADKIAGGYRIIHFQPPFGPDRYKEAFKLAETDSDIIVVDSMSHEWDGEGGILDMQEAELERMAGKDYGKRESCKMAAWIQPKKEHKFFIQHLLRCPLPVICCLRAQEKTHIIREPGKKTEVVTDKFTTPLFDSRFIFEMLVNLEVYSKDGVGGFCYVTKMTNEDLLTCLPKPDEQITYEHGAKIAAWCANASAAPGSPASRATESKPKSERNELVKALWEHKLISAIHLGEKARMPQVQQHLVDESYLSDTEQLGELGVERLKQVIAKLNAKSTQPQS